MATMTKVRQKFTRTVGILIFGIVILSILFALAYDLGYNPAAAFYATIAIILIGILARMVTGFRIRG
ncbi:hypothetical protein [Halobellus captivus]|uniref:hypothetical protein n=1 Tax=Halobellus captivus TaxID=2592614 RepID=UPI0011A6348A|nr:hypothetical protein [Halobellus captivus]